MHTDMFLTQGSMKPSQFSHSSTAPCMPVPAPSYRGGSVPQDTQDMKCSGVAGAGGRREPWRRSSPPSPRMFQPGLTDYPTRGHPICRLTLSLSLIMGSPSPEFMVDLGRRNRNRRSRGWEWVLKAPSWELTVCG